MKFRHQNVFLSKNDPSLVDHTKVSIIGFLSENDPYEANQFEVLRSKWIEDSKKLYGDFL